jgi:allantoin racemase
MRICIQSGTPLGTSDIYRPYYESLVRHAARVCRPDTVCEFPNLGKAYPGAARSRTHLHLVTHETIKSAMRAEREGFDVFLTQCLDLGFDELREVVDIPIVFMTQATLAYYSQLAPNFAFLVNSERLHYFFEDLGERYKVKDRMVPGGYVTFAFTDYANLWNNPESFVEEFMKVARDLAHRGATALYPAGLYLSQWLIDQGIREVNGALIMDPLAIGIKTAELMVDLERAGIKRYTKGRWAVPSKEVRNLLEVELGFESREQAAKQPTNQGRA